jgi:uncharacterized protein YpmS
MLRKWEFWTLTLLALLAAIFVVTNMVLFTTNRTAQTEVAGRQEYVQQTVQLEGLYRDIVKALADLSVRNQDEDLKGLLAAQGISITVNPAPAPAPAVNAPSRK